MPATTLPYTLIHIHRIQLNGYASKETHMGNAAKIFTTGRSQAVRLPLEFRFDCSEVYIRRDPVTGDVVLSRRPDGWDGFLTVCKTTQVPADFMTETDRNQDESTRDPFADTAA
jgi:antitoxin VapB